MAGGSFINMKTVTFFDDKRVLAAASKAQRTSLVRSGAFIRTVARRSMKKGRMLRPDEMDPSQRRAWETRVAIARRQGKPKPQRPRKSSAPGSPPHVRSGQLKRRLFFGWDTAARSVVVGPAKYKRGIAPSVLEYGGTVKYRKKSYRVEPRPYMKPALHEEIKRMPRRWRNSIKG